MTIGERIKKRREELKLSQEELATKLGYKSRSTINKIEAGINDITQSKVVEFANALETTVSYLMGWEKEKEEIKPATRSQLKFALFGNPDEDDDILDDILELAQLQKMLRENKKKESK